ncbi:low molecular weight protein-tyrosine-phosphatase [Bifidobacterium tsurumiense]|uniref:protein-tyrosine-phosphatase n=1 Tax=Bifidobacterium tsurumiense TaxID=356829 RepID=A0A087EC43_9BIFI|nr:low molecular weight protein-tyrosine-phosphatase [Bifidobacterium tsurumiense]
MEMHKNASDKYTIMTVCTGNICRSPMAEIILQSYVDREGLQDRVRVISSGVSDEEDGNPIDRRAVKVLRDRGYEIPAYHRAHRVTRDEIAQTDLFLPMTASHMRLCSVRFQMASVAKCICIAASIRLFRRRQGVMNHG